MFTSPITLCAGANIQQTSQTSYTIGFTVSTAPYIDLEARGMCMGGGGTATPPQIVAMWRCC